MKSLSYIHPHAFQASKTFGKRRDGSEQYPAWHQKSYSFGTTWGYCRVFGGLTFPLTTKQNDKRFRWTTTPQVICSLFDLKDRLTKETKSYYMFCWPLNRFHNTHIPSYTLLPPCSRICAEKKRRYASCRDQSHWEWGETSASERRGVRAPQWAEIGELLSARIDYMNQMDFLKWFI